MNTPIIITFTLADILWTTLNILGVVILVYLFLVLKELYKILKATTNFYNKNSESIDTFIKDGSVIVHKVSVIAESVPEEPFAFLDDIKSGFPIVQSLLSMIFGMFAGGKKNK